MRRTIYLFSLLLIGIAACRKNGDDKPVNCKITSVFMLPNGGSPEVINFSYDNSGKLKYMVVGNQTVEHFYYTNSYKRRISSGNGWVTNSYIELNTAGKPTSKKDTVYNGQSISHTYITTFEYNSQGELIKTFKDNNAQPAEVFTWVNGNLVKYQSGNNSYLLDYYTDQTNRDFGFMDLQLFASLSMNPAKSKNLLKSLANNGTQMNFHYQFDPFGNVKKWNATILGNADTVIRTNQQFMCD
jgi:hypothetical protein